MEEEKKEEDPVQAGDKAVVAGTSNKQSGKVNYTELTKDIVAKKPWLAELENKMS